VAGNCEHGYKITGSVKVASFLSSWVSQEGLCFTELFCYLCYS
jgi:hypothetical protein